MRQKFNKWIIFFAGYEYGSNSDNISEIESLISQNP